MRWPTRGSFLSQVATLVTGTAAAHVVVLVTLPLVTRLFTPAEMGIIAVFMAFCSPWSKASTLRYESAVLIAQDESEVISLVGLCFVALAATTLAAPLVLAMLVDNRMLGFEILPASTVWFAALTVLGLASFSVLRSWRIREAKFGMVSRATVMRALVYSATRIGAGALGYGLGGLLAAEIAAAWASLPTVGAGLGRKLMHARQSLAPRNLADMARRYVKFPKYELPSVVLDTLAYMLPVPIVSSLFGAHSAGLLALAFRVAGAPNMQVGFAVADVFQARFASHLRAGQHAAARAMFFGALRRLALIGLMPLAIVVLLAPPLMGTIFGAEWQDAGWTAAAIAPWMYASFVVGSLSRVISLVERQELKLIYDAAALASVVFVYFVARDFRFSFLETTIALSIANIAAYGVYLLILLHALNLPVRKVEH